MAPEAWITVEKILEPGETLPSDWPVEGTTGYDAMREVNGVFVDHDHEAGADHALPAADRRPADHRGAHRGRQADGGHRLLPAEIRRMAALVPDVPTPGGAGRDRGRLRGLPVLSAGRRRRLDHALATAAARHPELAATLDELSPRLHDQHDELARRMQQLSGATMAKGVEDTAYYRYARFIALNEVGGDPDAFGIPVAEFHRAQAVRQATSRSR